MAIINKLSIHQFRNLINQHIAPCPEINLFIGDNAQGKTNLIEAIYYLAHNRSFKTKTIQEVTNFANNQFQIKAEIGSDNIKLEKSKLKTIININQNKINNATQLSKKLPVQIITPDKGFIVNGTPKNKRSYLDWGMFHVKPSIAKNFKTYNKILKNINTLLINNQKDELDFWFLELAKAAVIINQNRLDYLQQLKQTLHSNKTKNLNNLIKSLDKFDYQFASGWTKEVDTTSQQSIYQYLSKNTNNSLRAKKLNYGSHKANIHFILNGKNECFLSRGEQKTLSIIFFLTQVTMLVDLKIEPIVLIDDLSSELDNTKIGIILQYLKKLKVQTFITDIGHHLPIINSVHPVIFKINQGVIKQQPQ